MTCTPAALAEQLQLLCPGKYEHAEGTLLVVGVHWENADLLLASLPAGAVVRAQKRDRFQAELSGVKILASASAEPWRYPYLATASAALAITLGRGAHLEAWQQGELREWSHQLLFDAPFGQPFENTSDDVDLLATLIVDQLPDNLAGPGDDGHWEAGLMRARGVLKTSPHLVEVTRAEGRVTGRGVTLTRPSAAGPNLGGVEPC
jgi:hypothetical protein